MVLLLNMDMSRAIAMTITISWFSRSFMDVVSIFIRFRVTISMVLLLNMDMSRAIAMTITISWFSRSLMDVVSIFVRLWVAISMVLLLNMDISRAISRLSRPLAISMVICLWMINLNLVI